MLNRASTALSWSRLIGITSGIFGVAVILGAADQVFAAGSFGPIARPSVFIALICGCAFLFLAFLLFAGREWARRRLLLATYVTLALVTVSFSIMIFQLSVVPSTSQPSRGLVGGGCALVAFLTPPAFLLAALHHTDVRRAFQPKNASSRTMKRIATD
jgi:hypothetical protein